MGFLRKTIFTYLCFSLLLFSACSKKLVLKDAVLNQDGYFTYGEVKERNFYNDFTISDNLEIEWINDAHGSFSSASIVVYDNFIFVGDLAGRLYSFDFEGGKELGLVKNSGEIFTTPLIHKNNLIFTFNDIDDPISTLYFYNFIEGDIEKEIKILGDCKNEMILLDDGFINLTEFGYLQKFDFEGEELWNYNTGEMTICSPALLNNNIVYGTVKGNIVAVDQSNGEVIYNKKISDRFESDVSVKNDHFFIGDIDGKFYSIRGDSGIVAWQYETGAKIKSMAVFNNNDLFIGNLSGKITSLTIEEGNFNWEYDTRGVINVPSLLFKNLLLVPDQFKKVHLLDPQNGTIKNILHFDERIRLTPIYYNGLIFIGTDRGELYAYKTIRIE